MVFFLNTCNFLLVLSSQWLIRWPVSLPTLPKPYDEARSCSRQDTILRKTGLRTVFEIRVHIRVKDPDARLFGNSFHLEFYEFGRIFQRLSFFFPCRFHIRAHRDRLSSISRQPLYSRRPSSGAEHAEVVSSRSKRSVMTPSRSLRISPPSLTTIQNGSTEKVSSFP